jgi:cytochrome c553
LRTSLSFATVCLFGAALAAGLPACGSSDDPSPGGAAGAHASGGSGVGGSGAAAGTPSAGGAGAGGSAPVLGDATKGAAVWTAQGCAACHGDNAAGNLGSNITWSKTAGIGNWTVAQFTNAVRNGKDDEGRDLCSSMTRFSAAMITDANMADLFAYLGTKPISDVPLKGSFCP